MPKARIKTGVARPEGRTAPKTVRDLRDFDPYELDDYLHRDDEPPKRRESKRRVL